MLTLQQAEVRTCKFLLIWNNHLGEPSYWKLLLPAGHDVIDALRNIHCKYLTRGGYLNEDEEANIRRVQDFMVNDRARAKCLRPHELAGHMGWDQIIISGISGA